MHILHITAHLGGGVGKAHAALRTAMAADIRETYLLLEEPRDRRYADDIADSGGEIVIARDLGHIAAFCGEADIVQFEFWNHPKLFECLAATDFRAMRSVFWSHVSGLFRPVIAPGLLTAADRFVFTTPASMVLAEGPAERQPMKFSAIGSGFGFFDALAGISPGQEEKHPIAYLGTVDFIKMHPGFFDAVDALSHDVDVAVWGGFDPAGEVVAKLAGMRHPDRIRLMGQTNAPQAALRQSKIFFYPLQPDHYGTAENALIEAMSLGLVPVVLANPAECAIVEDGITGYVCPSIDCCIAVLDRLLAQPDEVARIGAAAARVTREKYTPQRSASAFIELWASLLAEPKHGHDFAAITGRTPLDWYLATQRLPGESVELADTSGKQSKGTLAHFRSAFPNDPCWNAL